jgi:hypothetical protein
MKLLFQGGNKMSKTEFITKFMNELVMRKELIEIPRQEYLKLKVLIDRKGIDTKNSFRYMKWVEKYEQYPSVYDTGNSFLVESKEINYLLELAY